jgi:glycosyltransferase involved in cell wall biosynthesis
VDQGTGTKAASRPGSGSETGVVLIGRNEGQRILRAIEALAEPRPPLVYVDSGSHDGSPEAVEALGVPVHRLDPARPFSAARARNEGLAFLLERDLALTFVQFIDGDCALARDWLSTARDTLEAHPKVAMLAGILVELDPNLSPFARIMGVEWELPGLGEVESVGGICLARVAALEAVGGYDAGLIAGEEFELAQRLRQLNWRIARIDAPMATHDGGVTRVSQWWRRALRSGHTHVEAWLRHGKSSGRAGARTLLSSQVWGIGLPTIAIGGAFFTQGWSLLLLALYPLQIVRIAGRFRAMGFDGSTSRLFALHCLASMLPQALGQLRSLLLSLFQRKSKLIEYK